MPKKISSPDRMMPVNPTTTPLGPRSRSTNCKVMSISAAATAPDSNP
jgi:hypothetical protein